MTAANCVASGSPWINTMAGLADDPTNHGSVAHGTRIVKYSVVCSWLRYRRVTTARAGSSPQLAAPIEPVLPGQRVISKTRCGRPTVRSGDAPPKTLAFSQDNEGRPPGLLREGGNWSDGSH